MIRLTAIPKMLLRTLSFLVFSVGILTGLCSKAVGDDPSGPDPSNSDVALSISSIPLLKLAGPPGSRVAVLMRPDLESSNSWQVYTNIVLGDSPSLFVDWESTNGQRRFFMAVPAPPEGLNMGWIPPGTFQMGSPIEEVGSSTNERPRTQVNLSRGFWMGRFEVTQAEFRSVVGKNPSFFTSNDRFPVDSVTWRDATNFCGILTRSLSQSAQIHPGWEIRLPTEAEWEYACRAGTRTPFSFGIAASLGNANYSSP